jgi:hypothetical protein
MQSNSFQYDHKERTLRVHRWIVEHHNDINFEMLDNMSRVESRKEGGLTPDEMAMHEEYKALRVEFHEAHTYAYKAPEDAPLFMFAEGYRWLRREPIKFVYGMVGLVLGLVIGQALGFLIGLNH